MKSYKIISVMIAAVAVLFASAIPSYAWQPRTRIGERIQARGGILTKIRAARASCGTSVAATMSAPVAAPSCSGSMVASYGGSMAAPSCSGSTVSYVGSAPTPVYVSTSPKGSAEFAAQLASEGRMHHDRSYIGYENVASGASSPEEAIQMWQKSPPHRRNLPFITDIQCANGFCVGR